MKQTQTDILLNATAYNTMALYGQQQKTRFYLDPDKFLDWVYANHKFVQYNPRKTINRYGLSVTSLDGELSGIPDLDSLREYNQENNTNYNEKDFKTRTPVAEYPELKTILDQFGDAVFRSHILKLDPGGFFPPHRDHKTPFVDSFRLIIPLQYCNAPYFNFVLDGKITQWDSGFVYYADTTKEHYLFNSGGHPSYWLILNVETSVKTVSKVLNNLWVRV